MKPVYVSGGAFAAYMQEQDAGSARGEGDDEPIYIFDRHVLKVPTRDTDAVCGRAAEVNEEETRASDDGDDEEAEELCTVAIAAARAAVRAAYGGGAPPRLRAGDDPLDWEKAVFERLPPRLLPALRYLLLAPPRSGTVMHVDPAMTATWNVVTHGEKRWAAVAPGCPAEVVEAATPPDGTSWSILEWFRIEWPKVQTRCADLGIETFDWVQRKGETVYVPPGWWHAVLNLSATVAITHNVLHTEDLSAIVREGAAADGGVAECAPQCAPPRIGADTDSVTASLLTDAVVRHVATALELDLDVPRGMEGARAWLGALAAEGAISAEAASASRAHG
jgi:hypothetical protein